MRPGSDSGTSLNRGLPDPSLLVSTPAHCWQMSHTTPASGGMGGTELEEAVRVRISAMARARGLEVDLNVRVAARRVGPLGAGGDQSSRDRVSSGLSCLR